MGPAVTRFRDRCCCKVKACDVGEILISSLGDKDSNLDSQSQSLVSCHWTIPQWFAVHTLAHAWGNCENREAGGNYWPVALSQAGGAREGGHTASIGARASGASGANRALVTQLSAFTVDVLRAI
jgi:hypothetical protein